ncbi:MAG: hypothetical protein Kow0092_32990 [Deferrisomatales bacterium]
MSRTRGAALLVVVLLVSLLTVMVVEFLRESGLEGRAAANMRDLLQAHAYARSGAAVASALLLADLREDKDEGLESDHLGEGWAQPYPVPVGAAVVALEIEDLDGKFPLGALVDAHGRVRPKLAEAYRRFLDALAEHLKTVGPEEAAALLEHADREALVDALVDWMDEDETGDFEEAGEFEAPNAALESVDDLYRVPGYGEVPEGLSRPVADAVAPFVDVRSERRINLNTASIPVLCAFSEQIDYSRARDWAGELDETPAESSFNPNHYPSVREVTFVQSPFERVIRSRRFRVSISVSLGGVNHGAEAVVERDLSKNTVTTAEWSEGWLRRRWALPTGRGGTSEETAP